MRNILLILFLFPTTSFAGLLYSYNKKSPQLKVSNELKRDVNFWEDVFSQYEANQCVYHDSKNLDMVYMVSRVPLNDKRAMKKQMGKQKAMIRGALESLRRGKKPKTWMEKKIARVIPRRLKSSRFYRQAKSRIRCQRGVATDFRKSLERSKTYLPMIKKRLSKLNVPMDLAYLPHLESGFNKKAHSKVGARGLWQLMPGTARPFIKVNRRRDDRLNPHLATNVAARILKDNYRKTKSWPLAITAYNYGINGVVRAIKKYNSNDYGTIRRRHKTRIFGFAAKNFYPSFIAVRNLAMKHEKGKVFKRQNLARGNKESKTSRR